MNCLPLTALAFASWVNPAAKTVVFTKVGVRATHGHDTWKAVRPLVSPRATVLETHDMHLQVPGFDLARDQIASIATGACCARGGEATNNGVKGGRAKRRTAVGAMMQLMFGDYNVLVMWWAVSVLVSWGRNCSFV